MTTSSTFSQFRPVNFRAVIFGLAFVGFVLAAPAPGCAARPEETASASGAGGAGGAGGTGGTGGAGGAGGAGATGGAAGAGGGGGGCVLPTGDDCALCDVLVPGDAATIMDGITMAPSPGVVCIGPGTYPEQIILRPHVSLWGSGSGTRILGHVSTMSLPDPEPTPTVLRDLRIEADVGAAVTTCPPDESTCLSYLGLGGQTAALELERVAILADVSKGPVYCVELEAYGGSTSLTLRDAECASDQGIRFVNIVQDAPTTSRLTIERSRFRALDPAVGIAEPIYLLVMSASGNCGVAEVPAGTRASAIIQNNEFYQTKFDGIHVARCLAMTPEDAAQSDYLVANNTFFPFEGASADQSFAVFVEGDVGLLPRLRVVNNLFHTPNPTPIGGELPDLDIDNLRPLASPFVDLAAGDLRLVKGSTAIDAAAPAYAPMDDKMGKPRPVDGDGDGVALPDVGAHEYTP